MARSLKILIVTTGMRAARAIGPVMTQLEQEGHLVTLCADGPSIAYWRSCNVDIPYAGDNIDDEEGRRPTYASIVDTIFQINKPDVVITGLSMGPADPEYPYMWFEEMAGKKANALSIPLIHVETEWLEHRRSREVIPQVIITLDALAEGMIALQPHLRSTRIWLAGDPGMTIQKHQVESNDLPTRAIVDTAAGIVRDLEQSLRSPCILFVGEEDPHEDEALQIAIDSIALSKGAKCVLLPCLHPAYRKTFPGWELEVKQMAMARGVPALVLDSAAHPASIMAMVCPVTIAVSNRNLLVSAAFGNVPVSILTQKTKPAFRRAFPGPVDSHPLAMQGLAKVISGPVNLVDFLGQASTARSRLRAMQKDYFSRWWSPKQVAEKIVQFVR